MQNTISHIISLFRTTFSGPNNQAIKKAQQQLKSYTKNINQFYQLIFQILIMPIDNPIKDAATAYLKGITYQFSTNNLPQNTAELLKKLYGMMLNCKDLSHKHKHHLSVAIQYMLNNDNMNLYRQDFFKILINDISIPTDSYQLDSIILGLYAYLNSLIQIQEKVQFTKLIFCHLKNIAFQLYLNLSEKKQNQSLKSMIMTNQPSNLQLKRDLITADTLFDLLAILIERLEDQKQQCVQIFMQIQSDVQFKKILYNFLLFNSSQQPKQKSIFVKNSSFQVQINRLKENIFQIVYNLYTDAGLDFIQICYSTLSNQVCRVFNPKKHDSRLMIRIFQFLQKYVIKNAYYQIFSVISIDLFMKSLMYTKTSIDQINIMNEDPKQFVQITEEFCENLSSNVLKIRAGSLIKQLVIKIDGMMYSTFYILLMLISSSYKSIDLRATMQFKQAYDILQATDYIKTENSLICLALLYQNFKQRTQLLQQFRTFMIQYLPTFQNQQNQLVLLRLINLVGFSQQLNYLPLVVQKMRINDTFRTQGFHALDRIIKKQLNLQQQQFFINNLKCVIDLLKADDPIFETMLFKTSVNVLISNNIQISNEFVKILLKNMQKQLIKMKKQDNNIYVFFNLLLNTIQRQTDQLKIDQLEQKFLSLKIQLFIGKGYFQNIIQIMDKFLQKKNSINQRQKYFCQFTIQRINQCYKSNSLYIYYNKIIYRQTKYQNISLLFQMLYKLLFLENFDQDILTKYLTLLISQIILKFPDNPALSTVIQGILNRLKSSQGNKDSVLSKARLLSIILTSFYCAKQKTYKILVAIDSYYDLIKYLIENQKFFKHEIDRKTYVFGMCKILEIQVQNQRYIKQVLIAVLKMLNTTHNISKIKEKKKTLMLSSKNRRRKHYDHKKTKQQQQQQQQLDIQEIQEMDVENPIQQTVVSISQANSFKKYKLYFYQLNQFLYFQQLWRNTISHLIKIQLTQKQTQMLRDMLEIYRDQNDKTRKIYKIKRDD